MLSAGWGRVETSIFVARGGRVLGLLGLFGHCGAKAIVVCRLCFLYFTVFTASESGSWIESNIAS